MSPSFFALFNRSGVACAADTDHMIYRLAGRFPVAVAVSPDSSIPWERIIAEYRLSDPPERAGLKEYAADFEEFLSTVPVEESWNSTIFSPSTVVFFGFGSEDIYPGMLDALVWTSGDRTMKFQQLRLESVNSRRQAFYHTVGNFDSVSMLLDGVAGEVYSIMLAKRMESFEEFSKLAKERFRGTVYEPYVSARLDEFDAEGELYKIFEGGVRDYKRRLSAGVDSLSIEELVTAMEYIVNANAKLSRLHDGVRGERREAKEIAVMTIPEGLTWIKHGIYMRRNEI